MKTIGIRILDGKGDVLTVTLSDILEEIAESESLYWSLLFLDGTPVRGEGSFLQQFEKSINHSDNGLRIDLKELFVLSNKYFQMFEIVVLGAKDPSSLHRYQNETEMFKNCDIVIELIDCAFWEVYSKDLNFIDRLKKKFKNIEPLEL